MGYRDDRNALREHAEALEQELSAARAEIERLRAEDARGPAPGAAHESSGALLVVLGLISVLAAMSVPITRGPRLIGVVVGSVLIAWGVITNFVFFALPSQALVISGWTHKLTRGGRLIRLPIIQSATLLDLGVFRVPIFVKAAHTKDERAVDVEIVAHASVNPEPQALEQLLGTSARTRDKIVAAALEPALRRVLADLDSTEVHEERARTADSLRHASQPELDQLGVSLRGVYVLDVCAKGS